MLVFPVAAKTPATLHALPVGLTRIISKNIILKNNLWYRDYGK